MGNNYSWKCIKCDKEFRYKFTYENHLRIHGLRLLKNKEVKSLYERKEYVCKLCKKNKARRELFCEYCLSYPKRENNFRERLHIIIERYHSMTGNHKHLKKKNTKNRNI